MAALPSLRGPNEDRPAHLSHPGATTSRRRGSEADHAMQSGLSANSSRAALDLAISGLGMALAQGVYCAQALEDGRLVRPVARSLELRQPYCPTIPERGARRDIVAAFREWLIGECVRAVGSPALGAAARRRH